MRCPGQGTVSRLPSGRWRARLPRSLGDGGRQAGETFDTEGEARRWLAALIETVAPPTRAGTLAAWGATWLERREARGLSSYKQDLSRWAQHLAPSELADRDLRSLKPRDVLGFARWLSVRPAQRQVIGGGRSRDGKPISAQTQRHVLKLLDLCLGDAVMEGLIPTNPAADVRAVPAEDGEDLEAWTWLRPGEIAQLLRCDHLPLQARCCYVTAIYTGLRAGELWALRWERVRLSGAHTHLVVARSNKRRSTKSGKARQVPLLAPALEALRHLHAAQGCPAAGLVFPGADGEQRPVGDDHGWADRSRGAQGVSRGHRSIAGLRDDVRFHDLRHTCASLLLQQGMRLELVKEWLGHSSIVVTQRYAHLAAQHLHEAAARLPAHHETHHAPWSGVALPPSVGSVGLEPTTNGLKGRVPPEQDRGLTAPVVRSWCASAEGAACARAIIVLAAGGYVVPGVLLQQLGEGVGGIEGQRVLDGGLHALSAAIELAERVLGGTSEQQRLRAREG